MSTKRTLKKVTVLVLVFIMVVGAAPVSELSQLSDFFDSFGITAHAASESDLTFRLVNRGTEYEISDFDETAAGELTIPSTYNGKPVTSIGDKAFYNCTVLSSVTIPDNIFYIGEYIFFGCTGLISVTIGNSVTSIGDYSFSGCTGLSVVTIGNSVTSIGDHAFEDCTGLSSITIPDGVTSIGDYSFYGSAGLSSITFPDSITRVTQGAFDGTAWYNNLPDGLVYIGKVAYKYIGTMPDNTTVDIRNGTKAVSSAAFSNCTGLRLITIPDSVTSIGDSAFYECTSLSSVKIPDSVTRIGNYAFYFCIKLSTVAIPDKVTSIGNYAFYNCEGLSLVTIPDSVTHIGDNAFCSCRGLVSITIPDKVTSIGSGAFNGCTGLSSVTIGGSVPSIDQGTFVGCTGLTDITVSSANAYYSSQDGVLFNKDKTNLIYYPRGNKRTSYSIPNSVTSIGYSAFFDCTGLSSVTIPDSVTSIGDCAFYGYTGLRTVTIGNGVTSIGDWAFYSCTGLSSVTIPDSVTSIGGSAFEYCSGLSSVTIGNNVTSIGGSAFFGCSGLSSITLPKSVTSIGDYAFRGCTGLSSVTIPDSVTDIGNYAFEDCDPNLIVFGVPGSYAETFVNINGITFHPIGNTLYFSLNGEKEVCENSVFLYGFASPYATVDIFDGSVKTGSVATSGGGKWSGKFSLNNPVDGSTHSIVAKVNTGEENEGVSNTLNVKFDTRAVVCDKLEYYHYGQSYTVTPETLAQPLPVITIVPSYSHTFKVKLKNGATVTKLYVVSTKDGVSKKIEAKYDAATECWIATGWFDPEDKSYVPGEICIEYNNDNKIPLGYRTVKYLLAPSGFVYEAVESNTVDGAIATVQYKDGANAIVWNADEYNQINPISTLSDGKFACDVPDGDWRVKVSKAGYATSTTEWMSVPPERIGMKIPLVTKQAPKIEYFNVYSDSAELKFSQYMNIASVNTVNIIISANNAVVTGKWIPIDRTEVSTGSRVSYATTFSFTPNEVLSGYVSVRVDSYVENYAGRGTILNASNRLEQKVTGLNATTDIALDYNSSDKVTVTAVPAAVAAGKTVAVTSSDDFILGLSETTLTLDENGEAVLDVGALLPGTATISFALEGTNLTAKTDVMVEMTEITLTSIAIATMPNKLNYFVGDTFDKTGLTLTASFSNNTTKAIAATAIVCTHETFNRVGTQIVTAAYGGKTCTLEVNVISVALESVAIKTMPTKLNFFVGEALDTTGLSIELTYNSGTKETKTIGFTCTPATLSKIGTQTITASYGGKSCSFKVTVIAVTLESVSVKTMPTKLNYFVGEAFDKTGLTLTASYADSSTKTIAAADIACSPETFNTAGTQTITAAYGGKTCSFEVTAEAAPTASPTVTIKNLNNSSLIKYGETLCLTAETTDMPEGAKVKWSVKGSGVSLEVSDDGTTCDVKSIASGTVAVTAKIVDADDKPITDADGNEISASQQVKSKAGFLQKLAAFFKRLFGLTKIIVQSIDQ